MEKSSIIFYTNDKESQSGSYFTHPELGMIDTYQSAAFSVIVSLAQYLAWRFPDFPPPNMTTPITKQQMRIQTFPNYACGIGKLYQSWARLLIESVESGNSIRNNKECLYRVHVSQAYAQLLQEEGFQKTNYLGELKWNTISPELKQPSAAEERIIIYASCGEAEMRQFFYGQFYNNEKWVYFNILKGDFPTKEDFKKASAVVVPGSEKSIYQQIPQIQTFSNLLSLALNENKNLKYLGICFGAQLLTHSLGGKVGKSHKLHEGVLTVQILHKKRSSFPSKQFSEFFQLSQFKMMQYHGDEIKELPPDFEIIGTSSSTQKQIIVSKDRRMLGIQAHPQYSIQRSRVFEIQTEFSKNHNLDEITKIMERKEVRDETTVIRRTINKFLTCQ